MKKVLVSLSLALGLSVANATTIEFVHYYPPGGGADLQTSALIPELQKLGIDHKKVFTKSCHDAVEYTKSKKNAVMVSITGDFVEADSARCPGRSRVDNVKLFSTVGDVPIMFCASPHNNKLSLDEFSRSGKSYSVGVPVAIISNSFYLYARTQKNPINLTIVPYKGAGDLRTAVLAGNVDFFVAGSAAPLVNAGAVCLASSAKPNWANVPSFSDLSTHRNFPDVSLTTELWHVNTIDPEIEQAVAKAMASKSFQDKLAEIKVTHSGIGAGISRDSQLSRIKAVENFLDSVQKQK
jgi:tripartite-type tricarboxylate transporter receptor subunit TctC